MGWRRDILVAALGGVLAAGEACASGIGGHLCLDLDAALSRDGTFWVPMQIELPWQSGAGLADGWAYAPWYNGARHAVRVLADTTEGAHRRMRVTVNVNREASVPGGEATYDIDLQKTQDVWSGRFKGAFHPGTRHETEGRVRVQSRTPWPAACANHTPVEPGEHPRLAFRKADIARLRKLAASTPEGKAIMAHAERIVDQHPGGEAFSAYPSVGAGFLYVMTGDAAQAQKARRVVTETLLERAGQPAPEDGIDLADHAVQVMALALAYDLCHDGWEPDFRLRCAAEIRRRVLELEHGAVQGTPLRDDNRRTWSHRNAIRAACAGLGALAVLGDTDAAGAPAMPDAGAVAARAAWQIREFHRLALGGGAYCVEGSFCKALALSRGLAFFPVAFSRVLGKRIDHPPYARCLLAGYAMETPPKRGLPAVPAVVWAAGLSQVPDAQLPRMKALFDRCVGLQGDKSFAISDALAAPFVLASYPFDLQAGAQTQDGPWMDPDPDKGHWVFRSGWGEANDILLTLNMKSETPRDCMAAKRAGTLCDMKLYGFGRLWMSGRYLVTLDDAPRGNEHHGGRTLSWTIPEARACVMNWNLDRAYLGEPPASGTDNVEAAAAAAEAGAVVARLPHWTPLLDYGVRASRSMAVDLSGKSGSPLLVAVVDHVRRETVGDAAERERTDAQKAEEEALERERQKRELIKLLQMKAGLKVDPARPHDDAAYEHASAYWSLPFAAADPPGPLSTEKNTFLVGLPMGPTMNGVLVHPGVFRSGRLSARGNNDFFAVFTLQPGGPSRLEVEGVGMDSVVRVGGRTVRYDGKTIVLE
jgi:hypothetical protein